MTDGSSYRTYQPMNEKPGGTVGTISFFLAFVLEWLNGRFLHTCLSGSDP